MRVKGDEALIKSLNEFGDKLARKVLRKAGSKAATPVAKAARKLVKPVSPTIAKSIGTKVKIYKKSGNLFVAVGPKRDTPKSPSGHNPSKTAHLVDRGTQPHMIRLFGRVKFRHPGAKATPFLEPAKAETERETQRIFTRELASGIEKLAAEADAKNQG